MRFVAFLALVALVANASGKRVYGTGYFGVEKVTEVAKFSFRPGDSVIEGNVTYIDTARGSIYLFMDTNWQEKFHAEQDCHKVQHAHTRIKIGHIGNVGVGIGVGEGFDPVYDHMTNKYTWRFRWTVTHVVRTYGWYVVIADCSGYAHGDPGVVNPNEKKWKRRVRKNRFEYVIDLFNPDMDHLPADEHGLTTLYFIIMVCMVGFFYSTSGAYKKRTGNGLLFDSHSIIKAFAIAYTFQIISMSFELIHLWRYSVNGLGVFILDFFSEFFEGLAQLIISFCLLCLGNGWTMIDFSKSEGGARDQSFLKQLLNKPRLDDETPTLFILIVLVFVSTILQVINKVGGDDFTKFHDHDGISGKFLLFQRTAFGIAFFLSAKGTISSEQVRGKVQMEGFLRRLWLFGSVWFFAFPSLVFLASLFAHYLRHRIVTGGVLLIQSISLTLLANQLFSSSSWYSKVSVVGTTGMLPGFAGGKGGKLY